MRKEVRFNELQRKSFCKVERVGEEIFFHLTSGKYYKLFHEWMCCEDVHIEDICGNLEDLENTPISLAEESFSSDGGCVFWTFYRLRTIKGDVTIRFYGESMYYSVRVDLFYYDETIED